MMSMCLERLLLQVRRAGLWGAVFAAAGAGLLEPTEVTAEPIAYANPQGEGRFVWDSIIQDCHDSCRPIIDGQWLDITQPASAQPTVGSNPAPGSSFVTTISSESLQDGDIFIMIEHAFVEVDHTMEMGAQIIPDVLERGDVIDQSSIFDFGVKWNERHWEFPKDPTTGEILHNVFGLFPIGAPFFLGVKIVLPEDAPGDVHLGWIEAIWRNYKSRNIEPLSWGYETEPNTPIEVGAPAPGAGISLFMTGAVVASWRRRRG